MGWLWGYTLTRAQNETRSQAATAVGSTFTYQGRLNDGGAPATGSYDFQFALYDDAVACSQVGSTINQTLAVVMVCSPPASILATAYLMVGRVSWILPSSCPAEAVIPA